MSLATGRMRLRLAVNSIETEVNVKLQSGSNNCDGGEMFT